MNTSHFAFLPIHKVGVQINQKTGPPCRKSANAKTRPIPLIIVADCILCCFSLMSRNTLENLAAKWIAEINHYASSAPKILVGTKLDLYDELRRKKVKIVSNGDRPVKQKEIDSLMRGNTFLDYVPCSSISQVSLLKIA